jgi:hypothetical protein
MLLIEKNKIFFDTNVSPKFQDDWALKMPWAKCNFNEVGLITFVKCHVCSKIEKKDKVLVAKCDFIKKYVNKRKKFNGKWSMDPKFGLAKNKTIDVQFSTIIVLY